MNIIIDAEDDFLTGFKRIRASVKIGNYKHAIIVNMYDKPFYMSESLYLRKMIRFAKQELESHIEESIDYTKLYTPLH